jgi:hypothetical protein
MHALLGHALSLLRPPRRVVTFVDESWDWESQYNCNHFEIALSPKRKLSSPVSIRREQRKESDCSSWRALVVACMGLQIFRHEHEDSSRMPMLRGLRVPRDGGTSRSPSSSTGSTPQKSSLSTESENCHQKMIFADLLSESFGQFQKNSFRKN